MSTYVDLLSSLGVVHSTRCGSESDPVIRAVIIGYRDLNVTRSRINHAWSSFGVSAAFWGIKLNIISDKHGFFKSKT